MLAAQMVISRQDAAPAGHARRILVMSFSALRRRPRTDMALPFGQGTIQQTNVAVVCADLRDTTIPVIVIPCGTNP